MYLKADIERNILGEQIVGRTVTLH